MERNQWIVLTGALLSAVAGAAACAGPYYWASLENPEIWGIDSELLILALLIGGVIGGICAVKLAQVGRDMGARAAAAWVETARLLAGLVLGGLTSFALAFLSMGVLA